MNDLAWKKVNELCSGYGPQFNASAAYDVIVAAWRMGLDVVKAPEGSNLYGAYMQDKGLREQQADLGGYGGAAAQQQATR